MTARAENARHPAADSQRATKAKIVENADHGGENHPGPFLWVPTSENTIQSEKPCPSASLQINSDEFRLAPWTVAQIRSIITLTCRICSPPLSRAWVSPVSGGSENGEGLRTLRILKKKGLGTSPHRNSDARHSPNFVTLPQAYPTPRPLFPLAQGHPESELPSAMSPQRSRIVLLLPRAANLICPEFSETGQSP